MKLGKSGLGLGMAIAIMMAEMPVGAQEVWVYQVVSPNSAVAIYPVPPVDISYPADGSPARIISGDMSGQQESSLTPQEEAQRLQFPQIIIDAVPTSLARSLSFPPPLHTNGPSSP